MERAFKRKGSRSTHSGPENEAAREEITVVQVETTEMLSNTAEEHQFLPSHQEKLNSPIVKDNKGPEHEAASEEMTVVQVETTEMLSNSAEEHQFLPSPLEKLNSSMVKDNNGPGHEAASKEITAVQVECTQMLSHTEEEHQFLPPLLEELNSAIVNDNEGVSFDNQHTSNETITLRDPLVENFILAESSDVIESLFLEESTTSDTQNQYDNTRADERAMHGVDIAQNTSSPMHQGEGSLPQQEGTLPFIKKSKFWGITDSSEVFQLMPQKPHFRSLEQHNQELREGYAIGSMLSFTNLVESTWQAKLEDSRSKFENKLEALTYLEELGFVVQPIQTRLEELLRIKDSYSQFDDRSKVAEREFIEKKQKFDEVKKSITQLKIKLQTLVREKETEGSSVAELQTVFDEIKKNIQTTRLRFYSKVASPFISMHCE